MSTRHAEFNDINSFAPRIIAFVMGGLIVLVLAFSSTHIVPAGSRGVSVTFGRVNPAFRPEGLIFKKPIIEQIINIPVRQTTINGTAETFSSDLQTVQISFNVFYRIPEARVVALYHQYAARTVSDYYVTLIEPRVQDQIKTVAAHYKAEEIVKNRAEVKSSTLEGLRASLDGLLEINDLTISNIDLTDELERAIEQKQVAEQEAQKKIYDLQIAQKEAEIAVVRSEGEAKAIRIRGEALRAAPDVIQLEIAKKWDGKAPQSVVVGAGGANVLLPLK